MALKLGKATDSRIRKKAVVKDEEQRYLEQLVVEKDQPGYVQYLLQKGYSANTAYQYQKDTERFKKWLDGEQMTAAAVKHSDVLHYIQGKKVTAKQISIQRHLGSLKQYYHYLQASGYVATNPILNVQIKGIKRKVLHSILSKQELEKIYYDYKQLTVESLSKKRNEIIIGLLIYQGLNTNELQQLTVKDVKLREGKLYIKGSRRSNERTLALESHQILEFMEYTMQVREKILAETNKQTDLLLVTQGSSLKLHNVMQKLLKSLQSQNKQVLSAKQLRASVITHWLKHYNLREVQYRAGHRYVSSTEAYLMNDLEGLQDDIDKYHPII